MERFVTDTAIAKWIESVERDLLKDLTLAVGPKFSNS